MRCVQYELIFDDRILYTVPFDQRLWAVYVPHKVTNDVLLFVLECCLRICFCIHGYSRYFLRRVACAESGIKGLCFRHSSLVGYSCQRLFIKKNIPTMITSNIGKFFKILLRCGLNICLGDQNVCQLHLTSTILNPSMCNFGIFKLEFHSY